MPVSDQGTLSGHYTLIPRTLIFLTRHEQVLLLKGSPNKRLWANKYNGIGGHIERGEDVLSAAQRELREETGLDQIDLWLCGTVTIDTNQEVGIGLYIFQGECHSDEFKTSGEGTLEWVSLNDLGNLPLVEDLPTILARTLSMKTGDPPFSAHYRYTVNGDLKISIRPMQYQGRL